MGVVDDSISIQLILARENSVKAGFDDSIQSEMSAVVDEKKVKIGENSSTLHNFELSKNLGDSFHGVSESSGLQCGWSIEVDANEGNNSARIQRYARSASFSAENKKSASFREHASHRHNQGSFREKRGSLGEKQGSSRRSIREKRGSFREEQKKLVGKARDEAFC